MIVWRSTPVVPLGAFATGANTRAVPGWRAVMARSPHDADARAGNPIQVCESAERFWRRLLGSAIENPARLGESLRLRQSHESRLVERDGHNPVNRLLSRLVIAGVREGAGWSIGMLRWLPPRGAHRSEPKGRRRILDSHSRRQPGTGILETAMLEAVDVLVIRQRLVQRRNDRQCRDPGGTVKRDQDSRKLSDPMGHLSGR